MRLKILLILWIASSSMPLAFAGMYRCPAKDGSLTYSDMPCSPNAERIEAPQPTRIGTASSPVDGTSLPGASVPNEIERQRALVKAKGLEIRQRETVQCEAREMNDWYNAQVPRPDAKARMEKLGLIQEECRKIHHFTDEDAAAYSPSAGR